ncbi:MAG: MarR family transcriptional regulator, temperature-dependent positive regulator of motility [Streptomyces sp.]|jgi:DNA-binding MarR family transcriptional regulator|nr:MarR family transcriptional regulator, temperature-dependent positive regulator of motility [Streptomyces sp.]MDX6353018.1 MarR family transcriptional regulator, temperature-dependent positive regulator of motility [Streptomyces sp.]
MVDNAESNTGPQASPPALLEAPGFLVRRLYQAYVSAWVRGVDSSLTGPQFAVLTAVGARPGRDQRSMASAVSLDTSTMTDIVRRMEKRGLISRQTPVTDARRKLLYLTPEGESMLEHANRLARQLDERLLRPYGALERDELITTLTQLADHWETVPQEF